MRNRNKVIILIMLIIIAIILLFDIEFFIGTVVIYP
jgi:hypothetical protein